VRTWHKNTPPDFVFAWKASKFISHWKRLDKDNCQNSIDLMVTRLKILRDKAGPVLFQLPAHFEADCDRFAAFLQMLPINYRYAFEFRHTSWYDEKVLSLLRDHDVSLCLSDHHEAPAPWIVTARHIYVRGHGPSGRYKDNYSDHTLCDWANHIRRWRKQGRIVFAYFDNDYKSAAPHDARRLAEFLGLPARTVRKDESDKSVTSQS
jgi:uncharacterized protein YecE (DUF72 family)